MVKLIEKLKFIIDFKTNKRKFIALLLLCFALLLSVFIRGSTAAAEWFTHNVTDKIKWATGTVLNVFAFSFGEVLTAAFVVFCAYYIIACIAKTIKSKGERLKCLFKHILGSAVIVLSVVVLFTYFWGVNYYSESAVLKMGVQAQPTELEDLYNVTMLFAEKVSAASKEVPRDENGVFNTPKDDIYAMSEGLYDGLEETYPFLEGPDVMPKKMLFSRIMSETNYTGVFFPLTGEANINADQPVCLLPSTIAHELAHVRGVGPEQDCNFLAVLACEASEHEEYVYSGRLLAYIYLSNALYNEDVDLWREVYSTVSDEVKIDLADNSAYWAQYDSAATEVADTLYDEFLQSYGQSDGIKSYGRVTDLLIDMYKDEAK